MAADFVEEAIMEILIGDGEVKDIVGSRVYLGFIPQDAHLPAIAYGLVGAQDHAEDLLSSGQTPERRSYVFACDGLTGIAAVRLASALRARLNGFQGTVGNVDIQNVVRREERGNTDITNQKYWVSAIYEFTAVYL